MLVLSSTTQAKIISQLHIEVTPPFTVRRTTTPCNIHTVTYHNNATPLPFEKGVLLYPKMYFLPIHQSTIFPEFSSTRDENMSRYTRFFSIIHIQWNLSNPTHQGTKEMCRMVQGVGKLRFSFWLTEISQI